MATTTTGGVRRLWSVDIGAFRDHLLRLGPESRHQRFGMAADDAFVSAYAARCFGIDDVIYGWFDDGGRLRGAGELRGVGHNLPLGFGGAAEAAFSVEVEWRRRGIGTQLMDRIVRAARDRRAETLYMSCLTRNVAMQRLARKFAADVTFEPDGGAVSIERRPASPASAWQDMVADTAAYATAVLDLQRRVFAMPRF